MDREIYGQIDDQLISKYTGRCVVDFKNDSFCSRLIARRSAIFNRPRNLPKNFARLLIVPFSHSRRISLITRRKSVINSRNLRHQVRRRSILSTSSSTSFLSNYQKRWFWFSIPSRGFWIWFPFELRNHLLLLITAVESKNGKCFQTLDCILTRNPFLTGHRFSLAPPNTRSSIKPLHSPANRGISCSLKASEDEEEPNWPSRERTNERPPRSCKWVAELSMDYCELL